MFYLDDFLRYLQSKNYNKDNAIKIHVCGNKESTTTKRSLQGATCIRAGIFALI